MDELMVQACNWDAYIFQQGSLDHMC